jgi:hypothetical protein
MQPTQRPRIWDTPDDGFKQYVKPVRFTLSFLYALEPLRIFINTDRASISQMVRGELWRFYLLLRLSISRYHLIENLLLSRQYRQLDRRGLRPLWNGCKCGARKVHFFQKSSMSLS